MDWVYYVWRGADGSVFGIARQSGSEIEALGAGGWEARPELLSRLQDGSYFDEVTLAGAKGAAARVAFAWPAESAA